MTEPKTQTERAKEPMCRDCADEDGICPTRNLPCEPHITDWHIAQVEAATRDLREQLEAAETENGRLRETYKNLYVEGMELGLELAKGSTWHAFTNLKRWHRRFIEHAYDLAQEYLKKHGGE
jgi:hypothetical protein